MTAPSYDIVVFGATSFVGQILTKYLAEYLASQPEPVRWAIAGRSAAKLGELKQSLGALGQSLPVIVADAVIPGRRLRSLLSTSR